MNVRALRGALGRSLVLAIACGLWACEREPSASSSAKATGQGSGGQPPAAPGVDAVGTTQKSTPSYRDGEPGVRGRPSSAEPETPFHERIAKDILAACPPAKAGDRLSRDLAAARLAKLAELIDSPDETLGWGVYDAERGYDPSAYRLMLFEPSVWVKAVLSQFTCAGPYRMIKADRWTVLELDAAFRRELEPGEYAYPIWQSDAAWDAHVRAEALLLVFEGEVLRAAFVRAGAGRSPIGQPAWDGRWTWTEANGRKQPRGASFDLVFSEENPETSGLTRAYDALADWMNQAKCFDCHRPDNSAGVKRLYVLNYPSHALAARYALINLAQAAPSSRSDPHWDSLGGPNGEKVRSDLLRLAEAFAEAADHALAFELARRAIP